VKTTMQLRNLGSLVLGGYEIEGEKMIPKHLWTVSAPDISYGWLRKCI